MDPTQTAVAGQSSGLNTSNLLGGLLSAGGVGLSAYNQQQAYNGLQSALSTIGPTSLNGYTLGGPGGMSSGYNPNGSGSISLGSLNPAFGNLSGAAGSGSGLYDPTMLANLTGNANGTLGQSTSALNSAYGNYNAGMGAANTQLGSLNQTYGQVYNSTLGNLQAIQQPQVQQQAFGLQNSLFGKGTLDSTGATSGAISAANFGSQVNSMNAQDSLTAQQQALSAQTAGANNYSTLSNSANGILSNAFNNFGNTNQLISGLNTAQLNNSLQAVQGAGALNTLGLNNYNAALQTGSAQSTARNQSLFPYASVATALSGTQNGSNILGGALSSAGSSLSGNNSGVSGLLSSLLGKGVSSGSNSLLSSLFGGSSGSPFGSLTSGNVGNVGQVGGNSIAGQYASGLQGYDSSLLSGASNQVGSDIASGTGSWAGSAGYTPDLSSLGDMSSVNFGDALGSDLGSFSGAGGQAAGLGLDAAATEPGLEAVGTGAIDAAADAGAGIGIDAGATAGADAGAAAAGADAGGIGAGAGIGLGAASLAALPTAAFLYGVSQPAVQLTGKYWTNQTNSLQSAISSGDKGQVASVVNGLLAQPQSQIPANIQKLVYSTGLVPATGWGQGPIGTLTGKGGSTGGASAHQSSRS